MDWSRYAVGGAAARPDSFTGLKPDFASGVYRMVQDAHAAGIPLQITSAYRSPEVQARLYENALKKYGSPQAARKWVAPPGRSQHNFGTAVDFAVNGSLIRDANSAEARWIKENAAKYGLDVPMSWEPWQVEMAGARGQKQAPMTAGGGTDTLVGGLSINPAAVPDTLAPPTEAAPMQAEAPGGLLGRLFPDMSASRADEIRLGINGLLHNPNQGQQRAIMARMGQRQLDQREAKAQQQQAQQASQTARILRQNGAPEYLVQMAEAGHGKAALGEFTALKRGGSLSEAEQEIARMVEAGVPRNVAIGIKEGFLKPITDPVTGETDIVNVATGQVAHQVRRQTPTQETVPPTVPSEAPTAPAEPRAETSFGFGGLLRNGANQIADAAGADLPFPDVQETTSELGVMRESLLNQMASAYNRQPPSWLMQEIRNLIPAGGTIRGAQGAKSKFQALQQNIMQERDAALRSLERRQTNTSREQLEARVNGLNQALASLDNALSRFDQGDTGNTTSSGVQWSIER